MKKTLLSTLLLASLFTSPAWAVSVPASVDAPAPLVDDADGPRLAIPVQVVHVTVRHNGDRLIRLVANGLILAQDGQPDAWHGETVQRNLHARSFHPEDHPRYTVSTDVVRLGETVAVLWDASRHVAHLKVRTYGPPSVETEVIDVPTVTTPDGVERLAVDEPVIVGAQNAPSVPPSDRREIDVFVVGGPGGTGVDEVRVWNAARRTYDSLPPRAVVYDAR